MSSVGGQRTDNSFDSTADSEKVLYVAFSDAFRGLSPPYHMLFANIATNGASGRRCQR